MYDSCENLLWGACEVDLLGIHFSVDLENITTLNFIPILNNCKKFYINGRGENSPLEKITVVKTFILSSFNHIFSSLPITNNILVKKLNNLLYSFVWDNKPDKVNRKLITNSYINRGLNMVDINIFIKCQKVAWVKRPVQTPNAPWAKLFLSLISIDKSYLLGPLWAKITASNITNLFSKEVLMSWSFLLYERNPANIESHMSSWYNPQISTEPLFYPHWYNTGITTSLDLLNNDGSMKTLEELKNQFNIKSNFLEYLRLQRCLKRYFTNCDVNILNLPKPFLPPNLKILISQKKGCRQLYQQLNKQVENRVLH